MRCRVSGGQGCRSQKEVCVETGRHSMANGRLVSATQWLRQRRLLHLGIAAVVAEGR
jgi:hypothetical protein